MIFYVDEISAEMIACESNGEIIFERRAGGAPFSVACGSNKLGCKVGLEYGFETGKCLRRLNSYEKKCR